MCKRHVNKDCSFLALHWYRYAVRFQTFRSLHRVRQIDISIASIYLEQLIMTDTNCRMMAAERRYSGREDISNQTQVPSFCFKSSRTPLCLSNTDLSCFKTWIKKLQKLISFTSFNAQFVYLLTIYMLHYNLLHVSSINMPIFRRTYFIITESGIVTPCKRLYSMPDESRLCRAVYWEWRYQMLW